MPTLFVTTAVLLNAATISLLLLTNVRLLRTLKKCTELLTFWHGEAVDLMRKYEPARYTFLTLNTDKTKRATIDA